MTLDRSCLVGMTDYSGATIGDIVRHLREWIEETKDAIEKIEAEKRNLESLEYPSSPKRTFTVFVNMYLGLFERYIGDLLRLEEQLPISVEQRHIDTLQQLHQSSRNQFFALRDGFPGEVGDQHDKGWEGICTRMHAAAKEQLMSYADLGGMAVRLKAFLRERAPAEDSNSEKVVVEVAKPEKPDFTFCRKGKGWQVIWGGRETWLKDLRGLRFIEQLVQNPGRPFPWLDMVRVVEGWPGSPREVGIEDGFIKRTAGAIPGSVRKARNSVSFVIGYAVKKMGEEHPQLWLHFHNSIRKTATDISYCPDMLPSWKTDPSS